jgi:hypothetical protein
MRMIAGGPAEIVSSHSGVNVWVERGELAQE